MAYVCPRCHRDMVPATHQCAGLTQSAAANRKKPFRQQAKLLNFFNGTTQPLIRTVPCGIYPGLLRQYDVALQNWGNDIGSRIGLSQWKAFADKVTLADLAEFAPAEHVQTINEIWKEIVEFRPYDSVVAGMKDLGTPNHRSSLTRPTEPMFSAHGYAYRCDARKPASVLQTGFKPAYNFDPPDNVRGTIMHLCTTGGEGIPMSAGFWIGNRDIVNQTSICAARTLRGCGKFPSPETTGLHHFFAFRFDLQKKGFDTEARQLQTGGRWLPGEKAFPAITVGEIIAWTRVMKRGSDTGSSAFNSYSYVLLEPVWQYTQHATDADRQYLDAEIAALAATGSRMGGIGGAVGSVTITINKSEDFVVGQ
jgi:hypothetical protein